jgi:hypothetical protein
MYRAQATFAIVGCGTAKAFFRTVLVGLLVTVLTFKAARDLMPDSWQQP